MMKVVGEEGTSLEDFIVYLKGNFLDAVYLQQNSFDAVDAAVSTERQAHIFDILLAILGSDFSFADKDEARSWFNKARQLFIDYNYVAWNTSDFSRMEAEIAATRAEKASGVDPRVLKLLAGNHAEDFIKTVRGGV
jgi:V/A-type H+-transporting ATPase subunit A